MLPWPDPKKYKKSYLESKSARVTFIWIKGVAETDALARRRPTGTVTGTALSAPTDMRGVTTRTHPAGKEG